MCQVCPTSGPIEGAEWAWNENWFCVPKIHDLSIPEHLSNQIKLAYFHLSELFQKIQFALGDPVDNFSVWTSSWNLKNWVLNTNRLESKSHLEVKTTKSPLRETWNISVQTPWDLKWIHYFGNLEVVFIGNIELLCGNLRFFEQIALKLGHFTQKMQVF